MSPSLTWSALPTPPGSSSHRYPPSRSRSSSHTGPSCTTFTPLARQAWIDFELTDAGGNRVRAVDLRGRWLLVFFGYTYCPDLCPTALNVNLELRQHTTAKDRVGEFGHIDPQST
jgi:cytochrome oxidase Cu insertion factor (SCO1/SenC/PrrC family)